MMPAITIVIPGKPFAKQRPKFSRASGTAYTPKATVSFEATVRQLAALQFKRPIEGAVSIHIMARFEPPKSWSKAKRAAHHKAWHTQKPDMDNIQKAILDGLNRIAFADDSQVASLGGTKMWSDVAQTTVTIAAIDQ